MTFPVFPGSNPSGYNLTRSLRFRSSASAYLSRTPASTGNRQIWTYSLWVKRGALSTARLFSTGYIPNASNADIVDIYFSGDNLNIFMYDSATVRASCSTSAVFRDPAAWYHIVFAIDTTQATSSNRIKFYVNNVLQTFSSATYPAQNYNTFANTSGVLNSIGRYLGNGGSPDLDGYLTEVNFIDGQALTPSSFGSTNTLTGVWQPARYVGAYGTNGFYLPFTDNSALTTSSNVGLGKDFSGNGNYWATNNISITSGVTYDSMTDVPTLTSATAANFGVVNPLNSYAGNLSNANLTFTGSGASGWQSGFGTFQVSSGKWYWEATVGGMEYHVLGICTPQTTFTNNFGYPGAPPAGNLWAYFGINGQKIGPSNYSGTAYGSTYDAGTNSNFVIGVALDLDAGTITFYNQGVSQGVAFNTGLAGTAVTPLFGINNNGSGAKNWAVNFGQRPFAYTPPTGFVALNTYNLPTSTIVKGNTVMDATLYTGTGASLSVTNTASFKPDLVWVKSRSAATTNKLTDSVRGVTKALSSNSTDAESTDTQGLTAFGSVGFTVGTNTDYNNSGQTYVGWQWQAGQGTTSSNTNGSITSTVSVNATAGFSVVTYTGTGANATVGHGLGVAPSFIVVKQRNDSGTNWLSYHASLGATQGISLDSISATNTSSTYWNNTAPTSSVFSLGTTTNVNRSTGTYVAYCWTPIAGYSAFGSYTGNSSTDGPFVYTGFRPKYLLIRRTDAAASWLVFDSARDTYNAATKFLRTNLADAEATGADVALDFLSNGFKLRQTSNNINAGTIIYMAFAENPFKNALAR